MVTCEQCGKELKNNQGLKGHYQYAHRMASPRSAERVPTHHAELATVAQLEELRADAIEELEVAGEQLRAATASLMSAIAGLPGQVGSAEQRQELAHAPGLCKSGQCAPCRSSRKDYGAVVFRQGRKMLLEEIDSACEWAGEITVRNVVTNVMIAYRAKKQPGVDLEPLDFLDLMAGALDPASIDGAADPETDGDAPEADALTTISAPDPEPRLKPWPSEWVSR